MESKKTAIEWLVDELRNHIKEHGTLDAITISKLKMEAKAMEKKQIIRAFRYGFYILNSGEDADQYYTSTYGS